jgi:hypothetical protein
VDLQGAFVQGKSFCGPAEVHQHTTPVGQCGPHPRVVGAVGGLAELKGTLMQGQGFCRPARVRECSAQAIQICYDLRRVR